MLAHGSRGTVRVEDVFDTEPDDLWSAITEPARLERWMGTVGGDLRLGGEVDVAFTSGWTGPGRVDVCDRPHRLLLTMAPGTPEQTVIEATLTPVAEGTLLVVEERGLPTGVLPSHGAGWQVHIEDLAAHLAGRAALAWRPRWQERVPAFEQELDRGA